MLNSKNSLIGSSTSSSATTTTAVDLTALLVAPEGKGIIGRIISHDSWNNAPSGAPSAQANWTDYNHYNAYTGNNFVQFMNMLFGDGMGSTGDSQLVLGSRGHAVATSRILQFANGNRVGHNASLNNNNNSPPYGGYGFSCMPIRNTSTAAITVTVYAYTSNYWSSGYEGNSLFVLAPGNPKYSAVITTTSTLISNANYSGSSERQILTGNVTIPAESTVLIMLTNTDFYHTTNRFSGTNYFYNLNTTFLNTSIICDMRMLSTLAYARFNKAFNEAQAAALISWSTIWTQCASLYGDR